jgi:hypothetical protein
MRRRDNGRLRRLEWNALPMSNQVLLQHLAECVERAHEGPLDFGSVFHALGRDGIAMALLVLCLPFMQPVSLGPLAVGGGLMLAGIGWQMARGRNELWLPEKIRRQKLDAKGWDRLLGAMRWLVGLTQRFTRTRMTDLTDGERGHRIAGWFAVAGGLLLAIPLGGMPFNNMLPALVVAFAAIAVIERDGLMYAVAVFWGLVTLAYFGLIVYLLVYFGAEFTEWVETHLPSWL